MSRPYHKGERERMAARRERAWSLRLAGASIRRIANELGAAVSTVHADLEFELKALREKSASDATAARELELHRLDQVVLRASLRLSSNDWFKASMILLRAIEMRAKLLGLEAPTRIDVSGSLTLDNIRARLMAMGSESAARLRELLDRESILTEPEAMELAALREQAGLL